MIFDLSQAVMGGVILALIILHIYDRKQHQNQTESLLKAALSKSALEYKEALRTPEQHIAEAKAESKLAEDAWKLEHTEENSGKERYFPVG